LQNCSISKLKISISLGPGSNFEKMLKLNSHSNNTTHKFVDQSIKVKTWQLSSSIFQKKNRGLRLI
jgi:hypothetical protein